MGPKRLERSWKGFKEKKEYGLEFYGLGDDEAGNGVADEGVDYGIIPMADVALDAALAIDLEVEGVARMVTLGDIAANGFNLNIPRHREKA